MKLPIWIWAFPIAAIILFVIIFFLPLNPDPRFVELDGLNCDEMLEHYDYCVSHTMTPIWVSEWEITQQCREHYLDKIVKCYGEGTLQDQLALINSTGE